MGSISVFLFSTIVVILLIGSHLDEASGARVKTYLNRSDKRIEPARSYSFAVLSDIHIETAREHSVLAEAAVARINKLVVESEAKGSPLKFVVITGDLTNSAMPSQFAEVRQILDKLTIPYLPVIGNHDMWPYNSTWEDFGATGDTLFGLIFADKFKLVDSYNNKTVWNPEEKIHSWFQNWVIQLDGIAYIGLDWNSRAHAAGSLGYKGAWPGAQLHNFPGGTFTWLENVLKDLSKKNVNQVVMFHHHTYRAPFPVPDYIYGFSGDQKKQVRTMLHSVGLMPEQYWGVIAGHFHMWEDETSFDEWPQFREWETDACMNNGAITYVTVKENDIVNIEKVIP